MIAALLPTLKMAAHARESWLRREISQPSQSAQDVESVAFDFPFRYSPFVENAFTFPWPAFAAAAVVIRVPDHHSEPAPIRPLTYITLSVAVGFYWLAIGAWIDSRLMQHRSAVHAAWVELP